jgi:hypothetical protein
MAKSPGPEKWALLASKKRTDLGLGVLYNPSLGSVLIRVLNRVLVSRPVRLQVAMAAPPKIFKKGKLIAIVPKISGYSEEKGPNRQIIGFLPQIQIGAFPKSMTPFTPLVPFRFLSLSLSLSL